MTTSVTNMDIHDISRSCRTFGVKKYFIITPLAIQHDLIKRILGHWESDQSAAYNPDRQEALSIATLENSVSDAVETIQRLEDTPPLVVVTGANFKQNTLNIEEFRSRLAIDNRPIFLLFGTGWGLSQEVVEAAEVKLSPIKSLAGGDYNHLSVRSAVAIYLDRLRGFDQDKELRLSPL